MACLRCSAPVRAPGMPGSRESARAPLESALPEVPRCAPDGAPQPSPKDGLPKALARVWCAHCGAPLGVVPFPALYADRTSGRTGERLVDARQASCFYHGHRQAHVSCDRCGRFLCELCDLPMGDRHLCPSCLDAPRLPAEAGEVNAGKQRLLYDNIALSLSIFPLLLCIYPAILTAPVVLFMVFRYWKRQHDPIPRSRWRFVVAAVIAFLEIGLGVAAAAAIVFHFWD